MPASTPSTQPLPQQAALSNPVRLVPIRTVGDYLHVLARGPLLVPAATKVTIGLVLMAFGLVETFQAPELRGQLIGATLALLGAVTSGFATLGYLLLTLHNRSLEG